MRALAADAVFSVVGVLAPVITFSGETQVQTVIKGAAGYGIAVLLVMAVAKLACSSVGFKSGFLGGPIFLPIFASTACGPRAEPRVPQRAGGDLRRGSDGRSRLRAVPDPAHEGTARQAGRRRDDGRARLGPRWRRP